MNKTKMFIIATFIQHIFGSPSHNNQKKKPKKQIKGIQGKKKKEEEVKLSL